MEGRRDFVRLYPCAALDELEPFGSRVDMIKTVVRGWQDLDCFWANHWGGRQVSSPPTVRFN
jgi:hypothetical protein